MLNEHENSLLKLYSLELASECELAKNLKNFLEQNGLEINEANFYAILMRVLDLNTTLLKNACENAKIDWIEVEKNAFLLASEFHLNRHEILLKKLDNELFYFVHEVGKILSTCQIAWDEQVRKNNEFFKSLKNPFEYIKEHKLYYVDEAGNQADRMYALAVNLGSKDEKILPYSLYFKDEFEKIDGLFLDFLAKTSLSDEYKNYLEKLRLAFASCELSLKAFCDAERAWMDVKDSVQVGHFLEYYEDSFTHSVALEWDIRVDDGKFDSENYKNELKKTLKIAYEKANVDNKSALASSLGNIDKIQLHICKPAIFYAAEFNGLFSAQVVPNDETVSNERGKKIFAFRDYVYQKALAKPKMMLKNYVFSSEFNAFGDEILNDEKLWKKLYEISTIGHEGGHIFFIDSDTENVMNASGEFKNIEEFKASSGGIFAFLQDEKNMQNSTLKTALLHNIFARAISLQAYKGQKEIEPYYCEGLIFLKILKDSGVVKFNLDCLENNLPLCETNLENFERFADEFCKVYIQLAAHYLAKKNAGEFLLTYAKLKDFEYISSDFEIAQAAKIYRELFAKYAAIKENK